MAAAAVAEKPRQTAQQQAHEAQLKRLRGGVRVELYGGRESGVILTEADPDTGTITTHARRLDFLDAWLEQDRITRDQYYSAQDFRANFRVAGVGERYKTIFDITNTNSRGRLSDPMSGAADARRYVQISMDTLGRKAGDGLPKGATGAALMVYASGVDEAEAVRETVAVLKEAGLAPLDVTGHGTLDERLGEGQDVEAGERELMDKALAENAVIVAQVTPFYD